MLAFGEGPMVPGLMQLYIGNCCLSSSWALARAVQLPWLGIVIEKHPQDLPTELLALGSAMSWCVNHLAAEHGQALALPARACQPSATGQQGKQYVAKSLAPFGLASQVSGSQPLWEWNQGGFAAWLFFMWGWSPVESMWWKEEGVRALCRLPKWFSFVEFELLK